MGLTENSIQVPAELKAEGDIAHLSLTTAIAALGALEVRWFEVAGGTPSDLKETLNRMQALRETWPADYVIK